MHAAPNYTPDKRSHETAYEEPSGAASRRAMMIGAAIQMLVYQTSLQGCNFTPTVCDNPYAALRARNKGQSSTRAGLITYAAPPHVAGGEEIVGGRGSEPQRG